MYSASILYSSHKEPPQPAAPLWEERIVLIAASTDEEARSEALRLGELGSHSYAAADGATISWRFEGVLMVQELLQEPVAGNEVFSRYLSETEAESLRSKLP